MEEQRLIAHVKAQIRQARGPSAIIMDHEATVEYPDFDRFRAVQTVAVVRIPVRLHCCEYVDNYHIMADEEII